MILYEQEKIQLSEGLKPIDSLDVIAKVRNSLYIKSYVDKLKTITDKKERDSVKRTLPYFVWSRFKNNIRDLKNFEETYLIGFDIDGCNSENDAKRLKDIIISDNKTYMCFLSPSGLGVKVWYKFTDILTDIKKYRTVFDTLAEKVKTIYNIDSFGAKVDMAVKDVSRACFYSFDPDAYINEDCETINPNDYLPVISSSEQLTSLDVYNYSDKAYEDVIKIMTEHGYEVRDKDETKCYMGRVNPDGRSTHNALTIFRSVETPEGDEGRVGLYMFSTSDPILMSSEERKRRGMNATYSATDILMIYKFSNEYDMRSYLQAEGFDTGMVKDKFEQATLSTKIVAVLKNKYEFVFDDMSKRMYVSVYGKDWQLYNDMIDSDIRATLVEANLKNFQTIYYDIIMSRLAKVVNPINDMIKALDEMDSPDYDPVAELCKQFVLNYEMFNFRYKSSDIEGLDELNAKIDLAVSDSASAYEISSLYAEKNKLIEEYRNTKANEYVYKGIKKWFMSAVASWIKPDVANEIVLVLQSKKQGIGKTRMIRTFKPSFMDKLYYSEQLKQNGDFGRDTMMHVTGSLIINIDEMNALKGYDIDKFKSLVSNTHITFRVPYGRTTITARKYTSFVGTTNYDDFLSDKTGNRRYIVIPVLAVNHQHDINIDDVWKFAYDKVKAGEPHWIEDIDEVNAVNDGFQYDTYYEDNIVEYFEPYIGSERMGKLKEKNVTYLKGLDVYNWIFGKECDRKEYTRFRRALMSLGFEERSKRVPYYNFGNPCKVYIVKAMKKPKNYAMRHEDSEVCKAWKYAEEVIK